MRSISLVGLDVHAAQTHAAVLDMSTGELRSTKLRVAPVEVVDFLAGLPAPVQAVYEAGPTGFGLARQARARGLDVQVVAAGKVPRASGDRVNTDRRDAERLARLLAANRRASRRETTGSSSTDHQRLASVPFGVLRFASSQRSPADEAPTSQ